MEQGKHVWIEVLLGGTQSWLASRRGKSYLNNSSLQVTLPCSKRWTARAKWLWENSLATSLQSSADQLMVLTALLKIANRLQLFTPHRALGVSRDVSYGNHYRANHWALSCLHKRAELDWVSRGPPFNMSKECGPPDSSPQNMPELSPLRSKWSRFALYLPNNAFTKSLNAGEQNKFKYSNPSLNKN